MKLPFFFALRICAFVCHNFILNFRSLRASRSRAHTAHSHTRRLNECSHKRFNFIIYELASLLDLHVAVVFWRQMMLYFLCIIFLFFRFAFFSASRRCPSKRFRENIHPTLSDYPATRLVKLYLHQRRPLPLLRNRLAYTLTLGMGEYFSPNLLFGCYSHIIELLVLLLQACS